MANHPMNIKDMPLATISGKTVAYFRVEWPGYMVISECRLVEGKNGLFAAMPQKEYTAAGVKKYKAIVYLEKPLQDKVNAAAIEAYQLLGRAPTEPEDIPGSGIRGQGPGIREKLKTKN